MIRITAGVHKTCFKSVPISRKSCRAWICVSISVDTRSDARTAHPQNRHRSRAVESFGLLAHIHAAQRSCRGYSTGRSYPDRQFQNDMNDTFDSDAGHSCAVVLRAARRSASYSVSHSASFRETTRLAVARLAWSRAARHALLLSSPLATARHFLSSCSNVSMFGCARVAHDRPRTTASTPLSPRRAEPAHAAICTCT